MHQGVGAASKREGHRNRRDSHTAAMPLEERYRHLRIRRISRGARPWAPKLLKRRRRQPDRVRLSDQLARIERRFELLEIVARILRALIPPLRIFDERTADDAPESRGSTGLSSVTDFGVSLMIEEIIEMLVSPVNGRWPVAIS